MWPLPLVGALIGALGVRSLITPDGVNYLINAHVLFTSDMAGQYAFVREPGFALMLKAILLSLAGDNIVFGDVQGVMACTAVAAMGGAYFDVGHHWQRLVAGLVALSGTVYIKYAGTVLQQIGMALLLALMGTR